MNKTLLKLSSVSLILFLLTGNIFANDEKKKEPTKTEKANEPRPVDDATKQKPKEDYPKGGDKVEDEEDNNVTVKLSTINKYYIIKRSGLHYPPYRCLVYHKDGTQITIGTSKQKSFTFTIKKSLLKIGDEIIITSHLDTQGKSIKKKIIHDVEIIE